MDPQRACPVGSAPWGQGRGNPQRGKVGRERAQPARLGFSWLMGFLGRKLCREVVKERLLSAFQYTCLFLIFRTVRAKYTSVWVILLIF